MGMAVGVIIGGAFSAITTPLINDTTIPLLGIFTNSITLSAPPGRWKTRWSPMAASSKPYSIPR